MTKADEAVKCPVCGCAFTKIRANQRCCCKACGRKYANRKGSGKNYISYHTRQSETKSNVNLDIYLLAKEQVEKLFGKNHCSYGEYAYLLESGQLRVVVTETDRNGASLTVEVESNK